MERKEDEDNSYVILLLILLGLIGVSINYADEENKKIPVNVNSGKPEFIELPPMGPEKMDKIIQPPANLPQLNSVPHNLPVEVNIPGINQSPANFPQLNSVPHNLPVDMIPIINRNILESRTLDIGRFSYVRSAAQIIGANFFIAVIPTAVRDLLRNMRNSLAEYGHELNIRRNNMNDRIMEGMIRPVRGDPNPEVDDYGYPRGGGHHGFFIRGTQKFGNEYFILGGGISIEKMPRRDMLMLENYQRNQIIEDNLEVHVRTAEVINIENVRIDIEKLIEEDQPLSQDLIRDIILLFNKIKESVKNEDIKNRIDEILNTIREKFGIVGKNLLAEIVDILSKNKVEDIILELKNKGELFDQLKIKYNAYEKRRQVIIEKKNPNLRNENSKVFRTMFILFITMYYPRIARQQIFINMRNAAERVENYRQKQGMNGWVQDAKELLKQVGINL
jgi:hypothetical protein